jgi:transposase-like protein
MLGLPFPWYGWSEATNENLGGQQKPMIVKDACPACQSQQFKKNGHIHTGKQNHRCKDCGRQFVLPAENRVIEEEQRTLVERLLLEKISLHADVRTHVLNPRLT